MPEQPHKMTHEVARDDALGALLGWLPGYTDTPPDRPQYKIVLLEETINGGIFRWQPANPCNSEAHAEPDGAVFRLYVFAERVPPDEAPS